MLFEADESTMADLANATRNWNKTAGYTEAETTWYRDFLSPPTPVLDIDPSTDGSSAVIVPKQPFSDIWRERHPDLKHYTYFSYRFNARQKGLGWRLDMFVLSERIKERVQMCEIRDDIWGASDHCPIVMDIPEDVVL
jgi:AP endonuclease-1